MFQYLHVSHRGHQNYFYVSSLPSFFLSSTLASVSPPPAPLGITFLLAPVSPHSVCVHRPLLSLSFFIFDTFSVPTAGTGYGGSMAKNWLPLIFFGPLFPSHLPFDTVFKFILLTTFDHTPVSFSFLSFPLASPKISFLRPCNWRIFVIIKFGRKRNNEDSLERTVWFNTSCCCSKTKQFTVLFSLITKYHTLVLSHI